MPRLAIVDDKAPLNIAAAKQTPDYRSIARLLASAGVPEPAQPIGVREIDAAFANSSLSIEQRLACKSVLARCGLLI